jgi:hypothetical protein
VGGLDSTQALLGHGTAKVAEHYSEVTVEDMVKAAALVG